MGLTQTKLRDLKAKDFDKLLLKHQKKWMGMAEVAHDYAKNHICGGSEPKPDDIHKALLIALEPDEVLRIHQEENHCRFKRFREMFGDYVVDTYTNKGVQA